MKHLQRAPKAENEVELFRPFRLDLMQHEKAVEPFVNDESADYAGTATSKYNSEWGEWEVDSPNAVAYEQERSALAQSPLVRWDHFASVFDVLREQINVSHEVWTIAIMYLRRLSNTEFSGVAEA